MSSPHKFYEMTLTERLAEISVRTGLTSAEAASLSGESGLTPAQADHMVENAIGTFALPLGVAQNFLINSREVLIPMAVEEPSVIAGASFMAKLAQSGGGFTAEADPTLMIGQMQILDCPDRSGARKALLAHREEILAEAAAVDPTLVKLGGGPTDLEVREIEESTIGPFLVLHIIIDVRDAMGANAVNTALERLTPLIESITGGRVLLRILSNLADKRLARASVRIPADVLAFEGFSGEQVRDGIISAWAFAVADPYRAATHNKGIMNGIDAVVIATGNDWRAVEAGAHAYAARSGRYTSLSTWGTNSAGDLVGSLEMPMAVGIVGGATKVHPAAQAALKLMQVKSAMELAEIIVSIGLAQNLAALRALATEGIQRGHMSLHAHQVAIAAGVTPEQVEVVSARMVADKNISVKYAEEIIKKSVN
jgi:hydroxymethylglutaryl-CoA reductase